MTYRPGIDLTCSECEQREVIPRSEVALNIYGDRRQELRFRCPVCTVVQLVEVAPEQHLLMAVAIADKHHITPAKDKRYRETPLTESEIVQFGRELEADPTPIKDIHYEMKQEQRRLRREQRSTNRHGSLVMRIIHAFSENMTANRH